MQCDVRTFSERTGDDSEDGTENDNNHPEDGRVGQVCREWLVREDAVVANRLQDEEYQHHYGKNRHKNQLVRKDIVQAKVLQTEEEIIAAEVQQQFDLVCLEQEAQDAEIAFKVQEQLHLQEIEKQRHLEEADEQYARHLQDKEKERINRKKRQRHLEKERKQVEQARAHHSQENLITGSSTEASSPEGSVTDFSDLCMQPTPEMSEMEIRRLREQQDEELARLLQEQESKRGPPSEIDKKIAAETQDREIAKYLQEQERMKAKKARERARLKALQQQESSEQGQMRTPLPDDDYSESIPSPRSAKNESHLSNIAMAIDPTYNRQSSNSGNRQVASKPASVTPVKKPINSTMSVDRQPYQTEIRNVSPERSTRLREDDYDTPPYMPIQGQRRMGSLEKQYSKKNKRDNCKNQ